MATERAGQGHSFSAETHYRYRKAPGQGRNMMDIGQDKRGACRRQNGPAGEDGGEEKGGLSLDWGSWGPRAGLWSEDDLLHGVDTNWRCPLIKRMRIRWATSKRLVRRSVSNILVLAHFCYPLTLSLYADSICTSTRRAVVLATPLIHHDNASTLTRPQDP